jgi:hypothetical protein
MAGLGARAVINLSVSFIPGVAAVANAASAALLTELVGAYVDSACDDPEAARALSTEQITTALRARLKEVRWRTPKWWPWREVEVAA